MNVPLLFTVFTTVTFGKENEGTPRRATTKLTNPHLNSLVGSEVADQNRAAVWKLFNCNQSTVAQSNDARRDLQPQRCVNSGPA